MMYSSSRTTTRSAFLRKGAGLKHRQFFAAVGFVVILHGRTSLLKFERMVQAFRH